MLGNGFNNFPGMKMPFELFSNDLFTQQGSGNVSQNNPCGSIPLPNSDMQNQNNPMNTYMQFMLRKAMFENMFRQ